MKNLNVRMPDEMHARLAAAAEASRRSLNSEVLYLLDLGLIAEDEWTQGPRERHSNQPTSTKEKDQ